MHSEIFKVHMEEESHVCLLDHISRVAGSQLQLLWKAALQHPN